MYIFKKNMNICEYKNIDVYVDNNFYIIRTNYKYVCEIMRIYNIIPSPITKPPQKKHKLGSVSNLGKFEVGQFDF